MSLVAGAFACDISPCGAAPLFGYPNVRRLATGIHDPLRASALYLANGARSVVLVSLDILCLEPPVARRIRLGVSRACGTAEPCVFIACTHTHSGPVTSRFLAWKDDPGAPPPDPALLERIEERAAAAAAVAKARALPAEFAWTAADARGVGGNRLQPDGPTDPECGVLAVRTAGGGDWLAIALVYGMHPTVLHEDSTLVSSDFPFYARLSLQEQFGRETAALHFTAPCGDQSPRWFVKGQTFQEAERLGRMLGAAALDSVRKLEFSSFERDPLLAGALCRVTLPRRDLPSVAEAERDLRQRQNEHERLRADGAERARVRSAECSVFGAQSALCLARMQEEGDLDARLAEAGPPEIQGVRIGSAMLLGFPGEIFVEYSLELKRAVRARVFPVSLVNGDWQGYICTPDAAAAGGYEAANSLYSPEAGAVLVKAGTDLARDLADRSPALPARTDGKRGGYT